MPHWTEHTQYQFHCERMYPDQTAAEIAAAVEATIYVGCMVEEYVGAWEGKATPGFRVTWIAPHDDAEGENYTVNNLRVFLAAFTGNKCVMPTRQKIEVYCTCE